MGFVSTQKSDFSVGTPLPWPIYDREGNSLMAQGGVIETEEQLEALLAQKPVRELAWNLAPPAQDPGAVSNELDRALAEGKESQFTFHDMRLRVGDRLQLQPPPSVGTDRHVVKVIGYVENSSLLVTAPVENGLRVPLRDNDKIVARIFSSEKAFGFAAYVERVCKIPFDYLHLSFPKKIQGSIIRKAPRVRTKIIASIGKVEEGGGVERQPGVIANLSADGALVKARKPLATKGRAIDLAFRVTLHGIDAFLSVTAIVRSTFEDDSGEKGINHGVQFQKLQPNDTVILQSLIYQQMIEHPQSLA